MVTACTVHAPGSRRALRMTDSSSTSASQPGVWHTVTRRLAACTRCRACLHCVTELVKKQSHECIATEWQCGASVQFLQSTLAMIQNEWIQCVCPQQPQEIYYLIPLGLQRRTQLSRRTGTDSSAVVSFYRYGSRSVIRMSASCNQKWYVSHFFTTQLLRTPDTHPRLSFTGIPFIDWALSCG